MNNGKTPDALFNELRMAKLTHVIKEYSRDLLVIADPSKHPQRIGTIVLRYE